MLNTCYVLGIRIGEDGYEEKKQVDICRFRAKRKFAYWSCLEVISLTVGKSRVVRCH